VVKFDSRAMGTYTQTEMAIAAKNRALLTIPEEVRRRAGLKRGQEVEFKVSAGVINVVPKLPAADEEYTTAGRRLIDARLREARKGPYHGPFTTADEAIAFVRKTMREREAAKRRS